MLTFNLGKLVHYLLFLSSFSLLGFGCIEAQDHGERPDAGQFDDATPNDVREPMDAESPADAGPDTRSVPDAGASDSGEPDAEQPDADQPDAAVLGFGNFAPIDHRVIAERVSVAPNGDVYLTDGILQQENIIYRLTLAGDLVEVAGTGRTLDFQEGALPSRTDLFLPYAVATHPITGEVYFAEEYNRCVRRIGADGNVHTVVGPCLRQTQNEGPIENTGTLATSGGRRVDKLVFAEDGTLFLCDRTQINRVSGNRIEELIAYDAHSISGCALQEGVGLVFADRANHAIFLLDQETGEVDRIIGARTAFGGGFSGDGGSAHLAEFGGPNDVEILSDGSILVVDTFNERIRMVRDGIVTTVAGGGTSRDFEGTPPATDFAFASVMGIAEHPSGGFIVVDDWLNSMFHVRADGTIRTLVTNQID